MGILTKSCGLISKLHIILLNLFLPIQMLHKHQIMHPCYDYPKEKGK